MAKKMTPGSAMGAKTPGVASTIMNRMFKATSKVKKAAIGGIGKMPASMTNVKNPAWVSAGPAKPVTTMSRAPKSVASAFNGLNPSIRANSGGAMGGQSTNTVNLSQIHQKKGKKMKTTKKKASKIDMEMAFKKGKPKKKVSNKEAEACA